MTGWFERGGGGGEGGRGGGGREDMDRVWMVELMELLLNVDCG